MRGKGAERCFDFVLSDCVHQNRTKAQNSVKLSPEPNLAHIADFQMKMRPHPSGVRNHFR
jgi:hypothetical protein